MAQTAPPLVPSDRSKPRGGIVFSLPMNRGTLDDWNRRIPGSLPVILPLPEGVAMTSGSPPGMINPDSCRPGALTRRCERVSASIILPPDGIFTVKGRGEGEREPVIHN
jgi:hypothetical protein